MKINDLIDAILTQHGLVLGKTRSGKSSALRLMVERLLQRRAKAPVCIVDPKGDWWGLRSGFPVVVFGGEHADVPLQPSAGALVADLFGREGHSCIIDLGGWTAADRVRFFVGFAQALFSQPRAVRHLFIDECHNFAPQGKIMDPESGKMLHWANRLTSEGAGKGITLWSASQRPQKVHKDYVTCSETLVAMRLIHPLDRAAVKDWMDGADSKRGASILTELAQMPRGTGWVWSPEAKIGPVKVAFPKFETFDSFAAPSDRDIKRSWKPKAMDLAAVRTKMVEITEQAAANDPVALRKRIRELEKAKAPKAAPAVVVPKVDTKALRALEDALKHDREKMRRFAAQVSKALQPVLDAAVALVETARSEVKAGRLRLPTAMPTILAEPWKPQPKPGARTRIPATRSMEGVRRETPASESLPKGETAILKACAEHPDGCTREQLTVLAGYKSSSRNAYIARLAQKGYLTVTDRVRITEEGEAVLGDYEPLPKGDALLEHWLANLPEGEAKILEIVTRAYPESIARDEIDAGYKSSSRNAYIARLAARELVSSSSSGIKASPLLFNHG